MEQLPLLKMQNRLLTLDVVTSNFYSAIISPYVTGTLNVGGPTGALAASTIWDPIPKVDSKVQGDLSKLSKEAGIRLFVEQTHYQEAA